MKANFRGVLFVIGACLLGVLLGMAGFGCHYPTAQTAAKITTIQQQNLVDIAAIQARAKLLGAQAKANPIAHPIASANAAVKAAQKPLGFVATIAFLVAAGGFGLSFVTGLSWLSKIIVPVAGSVAVFSFFGLIALPFFPWVGLGVVALALALLIYEVIRAKSLKGGIERVEADLNFGSTSASLVTSGGNPIVAKLSHL